MANTLSRSVPCADCDMMKEKLKDLGFNVGDCTADQELPSFCRISFSDPQLALAAVASAPHTATAAPAAPAPAQAAPAPATAAAANAPMAAAPEFGGMALPLTTQAVKTVAGHLEVTLPALWAVLKVETSGCGFLPDRRPKILFERHCFHRLTAGRFDQAAPDISHKERGGYGADGANQYIRLQKAMALDRDAALKSASWGLGQVMGFNGAVAGFANAQQLAQACAESEDRQLAAMAAFIAHQNLGRFMRNGGWEDFARVYNGPASDTYAPKLRDAHAKFQAEGTPDLDVRQIQLALLLAGFDPKNPVDGEFGERTRSLVAAFQKRAGLPDTGNRDTATLARLWQEAGWA